MNLVTHGLKSRQEFSDLRVMAGVLRMNLQEFVKVHILGTLVYDQN